MFSFERYFRSDWRGGGTDYKSHRQLTGILCRGGASLLETAGRPRGRRVPGGSRPPSDDLTRAVYPWDLTTVSPREGPETLTPLRVLHKERNYLKRGKPGVVSERIVRPDPINPTESRTNSDYSGHVLTDRSQRKWTMPCSRPFGRRLRPK